MYGAKSHGVCEISENYSYKIILNQDSSVAKNTYSNGTKNINDKETRKNIINVTVNNYIQKHKRHILDEYKEKAISKNTKDYEEDFREVLEKAEQINSNNYTAIITTLYENTNFRSKEHFLCTKMLQMVAEFSERYNKGVITYTDNIEDEIDMLDSFERFINDETIKKAYEIITLTKIDTDLVIHVNENTKECILKDIEKYRTLLGIFLNNYIAILTTSFETDKNYSKDEENITKHNTQIKEKINKVISKFAIYDTQNVEITSGIKKNLLLDAIKEIKKHHAERKYKKLDVQIHLQLGIGTIMYNSLYQIYNLYINNIISKQNATCETYNESYMILNDIREIQQKLKEMFALNTPNRKVYIYFSLAKKSIMKQEDATAEHSDMKNDILEKCFHLAYTYEKIFTIIAYKIFKSGDTFDNFIVEDLPSTVFEEDEHINEIYGQYYGARIDTAAKTTANILQNMLAEPYNDIKTIQIFDMIKRKHIELQKQITDLLNKIIKANEQQKTKEMKKTLQTFDQSRVKPQKSYISSGTNEMSTDELLRYIEGGKSTKASKGKNKKQYNNIKNKANNKKNNAKSGKKSLLTPNDSSSQSDADEKIKDDEIIASKDALNMNTDAVNVIGNNEKKIETKTQSCSKAMINNSSGKTGVFTKVSYRRKRGNKEKENDTSKVKVEKERVSVSTSQKHATKAGINLEKAPNKEAEVKHRTEQRVNENGKITYAGMMQKTCSDGNTEPELTEQKQVEKSDKESRNTSAIAENTNSDSVQGIAEGGQKTLDTIDREKSIGKKKMTKQKRNKAKHKTTNQIQQQPLPQEVSDLILYVDMYGNVYSNKPLECIKNENGSITYTDQRVNDFLLNYFAASQNSNQTSPQPICSTTLANCSTMQQHTTETVNIHPKSLIIPSVITDTTNGTIKYKINGYVDLPQIIYYNGQYLCKLSDNYYYPMIVNLGQPHIVY
ncbi:hypothetical protein BDAP_000291 [Binucleata daphniae]